MFKYCAYFSPILYQYILLLLKSDRVAGVMENVNHFAYILRGPSHNVQNCTFSFENGVKLKIRLTVTESNQQILRS